MHSMILAPVVHEPGTQPAPWYAVYTKHQHEKSASDLLSRKGFTVLLPVYRAERRWKDRTKIVSLPLFPCYLFLRTNLDRKLDILRTPGVFWLVEIDGRACPIPESEVDAVRRITEESARVVPHPYPSPKDGDLVRILSGSLAGIQGILTNIRNRYRVVLSVEVLQKAIAVEVDLSNVEPVSALSGIVPPLPAHLRCIA